MLNFKAHFATFFKKSVKKNCEKFLVTKCKVFTFSVDRDILVSETMYELNDVPCAIALCDAQLLFKAAKLKQSIEIHVPVEQEFIVQLAETNYKNADGQSDFDE